MIMLKNLLMAALLTTATVVTVGCATQGHSRTAGDVVDDSTITTRVKTALLAEKEVNSFDISVETFNGVVQLSGFVNSQWQIDKAGQVAASVKGVVRVSNGLVHKPQ